MDTVKDLAVALATTERTANLDLAEWDPRTRPGMAMQKRQAVEVLPDLQTRYRTAVQREAIAIFTKGTFAEAFGVLAEQTGMAIAIKGTDLYERIGSDIWRSLGERPGPFGPNEIAVTLRVLRDIGNELKLLELPVPAFGGEGYVSSLEETVNLIRHYIRAGASKDSLNALWVEHLTANRALAIRYTGTGLVVVLSGLKQSEIDAMKTLFSGLQFTVSVMDPPTEESVVRELQSIQKKLRTKRKGE